MGKFLIMAAVAAAVGALLLAPSVLAGARWRSSRAIEERAIRALISEWVEAYLNLDAKLLAALWSDTFEAISRKSAPPTVTVEHIEFLRPEVALVQVSWQFSEGILLVDGDRIPPFSEIDTYVVTKTKDVWLVAAHNMQEKKP